ncbi:MAG: hypothetical protein IPL78_22530 [Chloroflexi bacterium]|nr:hypothetical protein [Chloroflexota bacterium]
MNQSTPVENYVPIRWQPVLRVLWVAVALLLFALYFVGLKPNYDELIQLCHTESCPVMSIAPEELQILESFGLSLNAYVYYYFGLEGILIVLFSTLALLVFWRRSDTWIGLVVSQAFLFAGLVFFSEENRALARAYPDIQLFTDFLTSFSVVLVLMLFYLFPDGRFTPRWMKWFAAALILAVVFDPLLNRGGVRAASATLFVILTFAVGAPMGLISQIYRFRKVANPSQRQQTKWVLFGLSSMFAGMFPWMVFGEIAPLPPGPSRLIFYLSFIPQYILIGLFPVTVVMAIMRYRLWEIDLVIRRTLQYILLTGLLALVYFGSVVLLQNIFIGLTGQNSQVVIVISTLAIAALFNPLRGRIQAFIDRRFYRRKYDAAQTLTQFAQTARDEVDMDKLAAALLSAVQETIQPEQLGLWLVRKWRPGRSED